MQGPFNGIFSEFANRIANAAKMAEENLKDREVSIPIEEDIKNLKRVINFAYGLLACMQLEGSDEAGEVDMKNMGIPLKAIPLPFNGVIRNYYNL